MSTDGTWGGGPPAGEPPHDDTASGVPAAPDTPPVFGPAPAPVYGPEPPPAFAPAAWPPPPFPPPSRRRPVLLITAVVAALVVLTGVPVAVFALRGSTSPHRAAARASASPSPSPTPLSPDGYQKVLDNATTELTAWFGKLSADHTATQLHTDVGGLQTELSLSGNILNMATPPPEVRRAHDQLAAALAQLSQIVDQAATDSGSGELCGGSSALSRITTSPAAAAVRAAVTALSTADPAHPYTVAAFLPAGTPEATRQLGNGTVIKKSAKGANTLKVEDQGDTDAVLSLVPAGTTTATLSVYVRATATATVNGIRDGSYDIYVASGHDWDSGTKAFTRDCQYEKFAEPASLTSTRTQYTIETITLNVSSGGNTTASPTDPDTFPT